MRPLGIEMKGFSAFREATTVSFEGAELVALVGPTGSGKSSLIDAITFALYGIVARYDDLRAVEPVIHQLEPEARVRLDFELGGERYTAVRVVRRQPKGGASTKEARLVRWDAAEGGDRRGDGGGDRTGSRGGDRTGDRGGDRTGDRGGDRTGDRAGAGDDAAGERTETVLASSAREMPGAVDALLHLSFEQFTKTIVLPQGDFAAFLREGPKERQQLLRRLLDVEVYARMGERARQRSKTAENEQALLTRERERLTVLDDDARAALGARAEALAALGPVVDGHLAEVGRLRSERDAAKARLATATGLLDALRALAVPEGVADLASAVRAAAEEVEAAGPRLAAARIARDEAEKAAATLDVTAVERALEKLADRDRRRAEVAELAAEIATAEADTTAVEALAAAEATLATARADHERARTADLAGSLVATLAVGEPCPVCRRAVDAIPDHDVAAELAAATDALDRATAAHRTAEQAASSARRRLDGLRDRHTRLAEELAALEIAIGPDVDRAELEAERERAAAQKQAVIAARAAVTAAEDALAAAQQRLAEVQRREAGERRHLTDARDSVAARQPPRPEGESLHDDWAALVDWATAQAADVAAEVESAQARVDAIRFESLALRKAIDDACAPVEISVEPIDGLVRRVAAAAASAEAEVGRADADRERAAELDAAIATATAAASVAASMGRLLNAQGFERWLLQAALDDLVARATERLLELSGGQFSLEAEDGEFYVRDHRNADERRGVRTLSGGETFLASLALALALSENVAELAAEGGPKLESMFLDEGFGTLDPDTLDLVASSVEELSASGRFVAIVTHIRDLADRVPVRFEVTRDTTTARVARVEA